MIRFFKQLIFFLFIFLLLCVLIIFFHSRINISQFNNIKGETIILGDSQAQNGMNPSFMQTGTINYSNSAEPFYIINQKIIKLSNIYKTEKIILNISNSSLNKTIESMWINNDTVYADKLSLYFGALDLPRPKGVKNDFKTQLKRLHKLIYRSIYTFERKILLGLEPYLGGFNPNYGSVDFTKKCRISNEKFKPSKLQIKELYKIQNYCVRNGIELILVNMPKYYSSKLELDEVFNRHSSTKFIDCHDWYLGRADCFADFNHLNQNGAALFSKKFALKLAKLSN